MSKLLIPFKLIGLVIMLPFELTKGKKKKIKNKIRNYVTTILS